MTEYEEKFIEYCEWQMASFERLSADNGKELLTRYKASLALPHVIDCSIELVGDPTHGEFDIQLCGGCKNGPITNEVFCPVCGCKIGKRCR